MTCQWQTGLLSIRSCGEPAAGGCSLCGMPICMAHAVQGTRGPACPGCAARNEGYADTEDTEQADARDEYYAPYGGAGAFGRPGFFSGRDAAMLGGGMAAMPPQPRVRRDGGNDYES